MLKKINEINFAKFAKNTNTQKIKLQTHQYPWFSVRRRHERPLKVPDLGRSQRWRNPNEVHRSTISHLGRG